MDDLSFVEKYCFEISPYGTDKDDDYTQLCDIVTDDTYIYMADRWNNRVVKLLKSDLSLHDYQVTTNATGGWCSICHGPEGVTLDEDYLYVGNGQNDDRVLKLDKFDLSLVAETGTHGSGPGEFNVVSSLAVDDTYVYLPDVANHRIVKLLKSNLSYVDEVGEFGSGQGKFYQPEDVTIDGEYLYIADSENHRIVIFNKTDLSYVDEFGSYGREDENLNYPLNVGIDDEYLYISDCRNHRIVKRSKDNYSVVEISGDPYQPGEREGLFKYPVGSYVDGDYLYVSSDSKLVVLDKDDLSYIDSVGFTESNIWSLPGYNDGKWHHLVLVVEADREMRLYLDGSLTESVDISGRPGNFNAPVSLLMGMKSYSFNGKMDEVKVHGRALSTREVKRIYRIEKFLGR
jgi:DNA-binding beta-propeller fold protein YncE